jgi:hypothetical protein
VRIGAKRLCKQAVIQLAEARAKLRPAWRRQRKAVRKSAMISHKCQRVMMTKRDGRPAVAATSN